MEAQSSPNSYELLKIILDFLGTIGWPVVILIIVLIFRKEIRRLIKRTQKLDLPGGISLETVGEEITKAEKLVTEIRLEKASEKEKAIIDVNFRTTANKRMMELGLETSPSGLNLDYYKKIADSDKRLALVGLKIDLEMMLNNLAKGYKISILDKEESVPRIISKLLDHKAISQNQYDLIHTIFRITNAAAHGAPISKDQVYQVLEIGQVLADYYKTWLNLGIKS